MIHKVLLSKAAQRPTLQRSVRALIAFSSSSGSNDSCHSSIGSELYHITSLSVRYQWLAQLPTCAYLVAGMYTKSKVFLLGIV